VENLIGHAATVAHLKKNIAEEKFPHAVIFSGEEGVGKRLVAEICAAALLCENPVDGSPCGKCENCHLVAARTHPDFYVVEAEETKTARNIKIGQIRALQAEAALRPINSARRVVIIDGAELMNNAAANCLLKTIEEPPSQTIFILLTASRSNLLMTIRSRCMTINFDKLPAAQIRDALISQGVEAQEAERLADKVCGLRVFEDEAGKMNLSLEAVGGKLLVVSQFTLYADLKSRRPGFSKAAKPEIAEPLYERFMAACEARGFAVEHGRFGAEMQVASVNDGPVTLFFDTDKTK